MKNMKKWKMQMYRAEVELRHDWTARIKVDTDSDCGASYVTIVVTLHDAEGLERAGDSLGGVESDGDWREQAAEMINELERKLRVLGEMEMRRPY